MPLMSCDRSHDGLGIDSSCSPHACVYIRVHACIYVRQVI